MRWAETVRVTNNGNVDCLATQASRAACWWDGALRGQIMAAKQPRIVFVTGGVSSSLGKGIASASLARLLSSRGLKVASLKMDPYLSIDAGTLAPGEHGECWVTPDSLETDLDLGHYYRFTDGELYAASCVTAGQVYFDVLSAERRGAYLGRTVQVVPHITDEIRRRVLRAGGWDVDHGVSVGPADVLIAEIGGTVGDIEILPFLEAVRQLRADLPLGSVCSLHLTLIPSVGPGHELKTKPSQHSVAMLRSHGVSPDILLARCSEPVPDALRRKLALTCGVHESRVVVGLDAPSIYAIPEALAAEKLDEAVAAVLGLDCGELDLSAWRAAVEPLIHPPARSVKIGIVGKYTAGHDAYLSVVEALRHAAGAAGASVEVVQVDAQAVADGMTSLDGLDGIVVPGGFGARGISGMMIAAGDARRRDIPFLGICLGLQVAVVEYARNVLGMAGATSSEWDEPGPKVITLLSSQREVVDMGGTMRLGNWPALLLPDSRVAQLYGAPPGSTITVDERHRHRYEVNPGFRGHLEAAGLACSGMSPDKRLVELVEIPGHKFFVATQSHPELLSKPGRPHPLFAGLVAAALK